MSKIFLFETIKIAAPRERVYRRLGYVGSKTTLSAKQQQEVDGFISEAESLVAVKGTAARIPIHEFKDNGVTLSTGIFFESKNLRDFLNGCSEVVLLGATAGSSITDQIKADSVSANATRAVVMDAVASEIVDGALSWIMENISHEVLRENKRLILKRFSAGFGDFNLDNQAIIYNALLLSRFGVKITSDYILVPEKTVTAVAGIQDKITKAAGLNDK